MANKIIIGSDIANPLYSFDNAAIQTVSCVLSSALSGDELAIDQLMPTVYSECCIRVRFVPSGSSGLLTKDGQRYMVYRGGLLDELPYGTPIWYYSDSVLMGKFYSKRVLRSGKTWFDLTAVSAIGVLDGQKHYGGIYTGQTFPAVAADIIGNSVLFSCKDELKKIQIYGWLPVDSRRANLHQLLFACGVTVSKDANGDMVLGFPDTGAVKSVADSRIFVGGSVDHMTPANRVEITEHAYMRLPTDEMVTLFDNTDGSGAASPGDPITFDAPMHDLKTSGSLKITASGVNYAALSGTGILTGRRYTHTTKIISRGTDGGQKTVSVTDATLVNVANSENVAKRVLSYYSSARTISADIVLKDEKPGDQIRFSNPFNEPETAFLSSMDISASSFLRAACELVTGYIPVGQGNNYDMVVVLTGSGSWTVPDGVTRILTVLIGGGCGGDSGTDGTRDGVGGKAGAGGMPGSVYSAAMDVSQGNTFPYNCGAAGVGGVPDGENSVPGSSGTATTFGSLSSAAGAAPSAGCANLFSGEVYAVPGAGGVPGGKGSSPAGDGPTVHYDGVDYYPGGRGADYEYKDYGTAHGGCGGGAAAGSNGGDGQRGHGASDSAGYYLEDGDGGDGADAVPGKDAATYGSGGEGGHGGGGAGQEGGSSAFPGSGGSGSKGGNGAPGCILLYFKKG